MKVIVKSAKLCIVLEANVKMNVDDDAVVAGVAENIALVLTSLLADVCVSFTTSAVLSDNICAANSRFVKSGRADQYMAAAPAIWGVAMDVPLRVFVAVSSSIHADVISEPGANISTQPPKISISKSVYHERKQQEE
jgi:hypothetical protein